jgi:hypothetical protein
MEEGNAYGGRGYWWYANERVEGMTTKAVHFKNWYNLKFVSIMPINWFLLLNVEVQF